MEEADEIETQGSTRLALSSLAEALLRAYAVSQPPTPIEHMLEHPPGGLASIDPERISSVMEHGLYNHSPRLAMARLLCREIAQSKTVQSSFGVSLPAVSYADVKFFARCLLMPPHWLQEQVEQGMSIEEISAYLQVPSFSVVTRLAELELPIPGLE